MNRRAFVTRLGAVLAAPLATEAQQAARVWRIGVIDPGPPTLSQRTAWAGFLQELRDAGYVVGQNLVFEFRQADRPEKLQGYAEELVRLGVDLLLTGGTPPTQAAKQATSTIPVVFYSVGDPVGSRLVATLSRPGGNLTGFTQTTRPINGKRVELLKETVPSLSLLAVLAGPNASLNLADTEDAARALGLRATTVWAQGPDELEGAFAKMVKERVGAIVVLPDVFFFGYRHRIAELAIRNRLPTMWELKGFVDAGGLMSYGANGADLIRRLGTYVVKIFRGAKPGDLPVEQAAKFDLIINFKTAKALGLTIPPSVLARADEVIE